MLKDKLRCFWVENESVNKICSGEKTLIVDDRIFRFALKNEYYLVDNSNCYGIIKLMDMLRLDPKEFNEKMKLHLISNIEKIKRWKTAHKTLYGYTFEFVEKFKVPKKIMLTSQPEPFSDHFLFSCKDDDIHFNNETKNMLSKVTEDQLLFDWEILSNWHSLKNDGLASEIELDDIFHLSKIIFNEFKKRGIINNLSLSGSTKDELNLFDVVSDGLTTKVELLNKFLLMPSIIIIKSYDSIDVLSNDLFGRE